MKINVVIVTIGSQLGDLRGLPKTSPDQQVRQGSSCWFPDPQFEERFAQKTK